MGCEIYIYIYIYNSIVTKNKWRDLKFEPSKMSKNTNSITKYFANLD